MHQIKKKIRKRILNFIMKNLQKVAVVTGSNKGIGYAIVKNLSNKFDGIIYLTGRSLLEK